MPHLHLWAPMAPICLPIGKVVLMNAAVLHSTECQKRSFVQLQVDENSARAAALHYDLELQNSIELKIGLTNWAPKVLHTCHLGS